MLLCQRVVQKIGLFSSTLPFVYHYRYMNSFFFCLMGVNSFAHHVPLNLVNVPYRVIVYFTEQKKSPDSIAHLTKAVIRYFNTSLYIVTVLLLQI